MLRLTLASLIVVGFAALYMRDRTFTVAQPPAPPPPVASNAPPSSAANLIAGAIGSAEPEPDAGAPAVAPPTGKPTAAASIAPAPRVAQRGDENDYKSWGIPPLNRKVSENVLAETCSLYADPKQGKTSKSLLGQDVDWGPVTRRQVVHVNDSGREGVALVYEVKGQRRSYQFDGSDTGPATGLLDVPVGTWVALCPSHETDNFRSDERDWDSFVDVTAYLSLGKPPAITAFTKDNPIHVSSTKLRNAQTHDKIEDELTGAVFVHTWLRSVDGHRWTTDDTWAADIAENLPNAAKLHAGMAVWLVLKDLHTVKYTGADANHDELLLIGTAKAVITDMFPAP